MANSFSVRSRSRMMLMTKMKRTIVLLALALVCVAFCSHDVCAFAGLPRPLPSSSLNRRHGRNEWSPWHDRETTTIPTSCGGIVALTFSGSKMATRFATNRDSASDVSDSEMEWSDFEGRVIGTVHDDDAQSDASDDDTIGPPPNIVSYDDFGDPLSVTSLIGDESGGGTTSHKTTVVLNERIQTMQSRQFRQDAVNARNYNLGNWNVRGFSMEQAATTGSSSSSSNDDDNATETTGLAVRVTGVAQDSRFTNQHLSATTSSAASTSTPPVVWVGRSDGRVFGVRLGTEYLTKFGQESTEDATPESAYLTDNEDDDSDNVYIGNDVAEAAAAHASSAMTQRPNEIVAELRLDNTAAADAASIKVMAVVSDMTADDEDDDEPHAYHVFAATGGNGATIHQWHVTTATSTRVEDVVTTPPTTVIPALSHSGGSVHALQAIHVSDTTSGGGGDSPLLLLVWSDGSRVSIWDVRARALLGQFAVNVSEDDSGPASGTTENTVTSLYCTTSHIFVGCTKGQVLVYDTAEILSLSRRSRVGTTLTTQETGAAFEVLKPTLVAQWRASDHAISAVASGGVGTMGSRGTSSSMSPSSSSTMVLFTGDSKGQVKRWEVLGVGRAIAAATSTAAAATASSASSDEAMYTAPKLDAWPKLTTQRLPKRAHLFLGHETAITAFAAINDIRFASASADGTVRVWNAVTGKELCHLGGFGEPVHSLCLFDSLTDGVDSTIESKNTLLVTDGMGKYVCVHDFSVDDPDADYELDMPEYLRD